MGEILGLGLSHYPGPLVPAGYWSRHLKTNVERGRIPADVFADRSRWPADMLAEWGSDDGQAAAADHQGRLLRGYRQLRQEIDDFAPDVILIWGDDQYENYKKDCIPPFSVYLGDEVRSIPLADNERGAFRTAENSWGLAPETEFTYRCHSEAASGLIGSLLSEDFDLAYSYATRHPRGLSHSFANTMLYLDYDRRGFDYPIIPFHVNCYGEQLMTTSAGVVGESTGQLSPPSPSPRRCFNLGRATARYFADSPWRVVLLASSSWSHASLTRKHDRLYPDLVADRARFADLTDGNFRSWDALTGRQIEDCGQNEILNWVCLAGAMTQLGTAPTRTELVESYIFNSSKCFAVFQPHRAASTTSAREDSS